MRQWDTKKQFKPRYGMIAGLVFFGLVKAYTHPNWRYAFADLWGSVWRMFCHLFGFVIAVVVLVLCPVSFPFLCWAEYRQSRRARLNYLRQNRAADEDI